MMSSFAGAQNLRVVFVKNTILDTPSPRIIPQLKKKIITFCTRSRANTQRDTHTQTKKNKKLQNGR